LSISMCGNPFRGIEGIAIQQPVKNLNTAIHGEGKQMTYKEIEELIFLKYT